MIWISLNTCESEEVGKHDAFREGVDEATSFPDQGKAIDSIDYSEDACERKKWQGVLG